MHPGDLLFLATALVTVVAALRASWRLFRGSRRAARLIVTRWAVGAAAYLAALLVVSLVRPARGIALGDDECFDDWCVAVTATESRGSLIVVTLRVSNRSRGRSQAEPDAYVFLRDEGGREFLPFIASAQRFALGDRVPAGESRTLTATFEVPVDAHDPVLVKARRARFPGILIIGDPASLMHRPTTHRLAP